MAHKVVVPVITPGIDGALFKVIANVEAVLVPQLFVAVTLTLPEVDPKSTVIDVVP